MSVLDDMADHLMGLAPPEAQGRASGVLMDHHDMLKQVMGMCGASERSTEALLWDLAQEGLQGCDSASGFVATEATGPTHRPRRDDGIVGMFEVDFSGTLYEGINYVRGPGSTQIDFHCSSCSLSESSPGLLAPAPPLPVSSAVTAVYHALSFGR